MKKSGMVKKWRIMFSGFHRVSDNCPLLRSDLDNSKGGFVKAFRWLLTFWGAFAVIVPLWAQELDPCVAKGLQKISLCKEKFGRKPPLNPEFPGEPEPDGARVVREKLLEGCMKMVSDYITVCLTEAILDHPPLYFPPDNVPDTCPNDPKPMAFVPNGSEGLKTERSIGMVPTGYEFQLVLAPNQTQGWNLHLINGLPGEPGEGVFLNRVQGQVEINGQIVVSIDELSGFSHVLCIPIQLQVGQNIIKVKINKVDGPNVTTGFLTAFLARGVS